MFSSLMTMLFPLLMLTLPGPNLLVNPGFDDGLKGWQQTAEASPVKATYEVTQLNGRTVAHLVVPQGTPMVSPATTPPPTTPPRRRPPPMETHALYQEVAVQPGQMVTATGQALRKGEMKGRSGARLEISFWDSQGKNLSAAHSDRAFATEQWTQLTMPLSHAVIVPPGAAKMRLAMLMVGSGEAYFDDLQLVCLPSPVAAPLSGPVTLNVTQKVVCDSLVGFGAEDDGWFNTDANRNQGVTEEDNTLREERIKWVSPDWIRTFIWALEWCPSGDPSKVDFETPGMKSHYRALDLYQKLGASVDITGVAWGSYQVYKDPERYAQGIGALLEYMVKKKGYTCIKYWTLHNEPNLEFVGSRRRSGYPFEHFVKLHVLVKQEFIKRGLDIKVVGSDDSDSTTFFESCFSNPDYNRVADVYCSHAYLGVDSLFNMAPFFDQRMSLLERQKPVKPLIIGEFGFLSPDFTASTNANMLTYPYAVWSAAFAIEGLNRGVAGFSIWTMDECYYPGNEKMQFGLWGFKDTGWKPRPVYYAWSTFCRLTKTGDKVRRCDSTSPGHVVGAVVNKTLFWVNRGDQPAEVIVTGLKASEVRIMQESTLAGDRECGVVAKLKEGRFTAPPQSFGYAR